MAHSPVSLLPGQSPLLVVISGPSGVGKDTVIQELKRRNLPLHVVVTATDRLPRAGEVDGVDYHFVSTQRFEEMIRNHELIEYARVYDDYKGIPRREVTDAMQSGKDVIFRVDVQGAARLRQLFPEAVMIFLLPASMEELEARLAARHTETPETLKKRIETAREEMKRLNEFEYAVVNADGQLEKTIEQILAILTAEHLKVKPRTYSL
ncbi:guanylate kinase [Bellilinea caldifistulae]|uniref:Guanylate kinase n=1 Tax=Bellilinea caldifistulae TaxID=360411 RepID=A0A0P6X783_9CHLR|nr:guanylate kinase [Bellilinea caldifistulae]KPL75216.1 guanylate kinase [Bellilinea caldifistulae]GAP09354.1 guanylate kinase [Bellilinea caldifistulae]